MIISMVSYQNSAKRRSSRRLIMWRHHYPLSSSIVMLPTDALSVLEGAPSLFTRVTSRVFVVAVRLTCFNEHILPSGVQRPEVRRQSMSRTVIPYKSGQGVKEDIIVG